MFRPLSLFIGSRYTRAKRRSQYISFISLTSMIGLGLGVLALILVLSVMNGFQREMSSRILGLVPHAVISASEPLHDWQSVAERAMANPEIIGAAPLTRLDGMLSFHGEMQPIQVSGIDPISEAKVSSLPAQLIGGRLDDLQPGEFGVIVGQLTARRFGLTLGDKLTLIVPELSDSPGGVTPRMHRLTVAGVFKVGADLDGSLAMVHIADAASMQRWEPGQVEGVRLKLTDLYRSATVAGQLAKELGPNFRAEDWTRTEGSLFSAMQMEKTMIGLLLLLIIAVAAFNIIATLIMVVSDKRMDIAILRTLGATPRQIMTIFMIQGCIIGFSGTLVGAVLGVAAALNVSKLVNWIEKTLGRHVFGSDAYFITSLPSQLHWQDVLLVVSAGLLMSFLATLYPAWRAAQTHPAEALRYA
ncbi:lipoprotein-releasing ABC transporter permease subunit [Azomonas macrocytogenes]|uniref:Lipoprotein-releasing system permease protein n=1 Tax=Azomonas macrocytogenes TaxID=69962 RepID=A0A839T6A0_AZOMA|nr:lipoprotein-releasing ABC transporter permease subunit [Azomonas macrocytogenes]MBB3104589.1 lipoprotein-releasing system permease protein [Azomonas macrocytogenes]